MLLQLQNVSGGYGKGDIVKNVSCEADEGDILCLAGPNGCGKTTLFRLIMGSIPLSGGRILIDGQDHLKLSPTRACKPYRLYSTVPFSRLFLYRAGCGAHGPCLPFFCL